VTGTHLYGLVPSSRIVTSRSKHLGECHVPRTKIKEIGEEWAAIELDGLPIELTVVALLCFSWVRPYKTNIKLIAHESDVRVRQQPCWGRVVMILQI
jgi:hypothetical protein